MIVKEVKLTESITKKLIELSVDWENENSCYGYKRNDVKDIEGNRVFVAMDDDTICGYLFGHTEIVEKDTSIYKAGNNTFEIDELYVRPQFRNQGIGKKLFQYVENAVAQEVDMIMLSTATKNYRAILHFYIDELGMKFWCAQLFKKIE